MNNKSRKQNRLEGFDYSQNGVYFVTICTREKQCVLSQITQDTVGCDAYIAPRILLSDYGKVIEKYLESMNGMVSYVIMPNHIHFIVIKNGAMRASHPTTLSSDVRSLKTLVTKDLGVSLWQRSFYDHIIRDEADYIYHLQYIEENPKKWMMGKDEYYT